MPETLDVATLLPNAFEPLRKFRFIFNIEGIDAFTLKSATKPQLTFDETVIDWMNVKRYVAGKPTWAPITITLWDPISPSATQKVMDWVRLCLDVTTGRMGYAVSYQKDFNIKMLDPAGTVVQKWLVRRAYVTDFNGNDLDYATSDPTDLTLSIRYDDALFEF